MVRTGDRLRAACACVALLAAAACSDGDEPSSASETTEDRESVEPTDEPSPEESDDEPAEPVTQPPPRITDKDSGFSFVLPRRAEPQESEQRVQGAVVTRRAYSVDVGDVGQTVMVVETPAPLQVQEPSAVADQVVNGLISAGGKDARVLKESEGTFVGMPAHTVTLTFTSPQGDTCYWRVTTATLDRKTLILQTLRFAPRDKPTAKVDQLHADLENSVQVVL
jgi:hypothetical protein